MSAPDLRQFKVTFFAVAPSGAVAGRATAHVVATARDEARAVAHGACATALAMIGAPLPLQLHKTFDLGSFGAPGSALRARVSPGQVIAIEATLAYG